MSDLDDNDFFQQPFHQPFLSFRRKFGCRVHLLLSATVAAVTVSGQRRRLERRRTRGRRRTAEL
jgi:hypothetical protein